MFKGENIPEPVVPESFKVLLKELRSIGLDVKILNEDQNEVIIKELDEDEFEGDDEVRHVMEADDAAATMTEEVPADMSVVDVEEEVLGHEAATEDDDIIGLTDADAE